MEHFDFRLPNIYHLLSITYSLMCVVLLLLLSAAAQSLLYYIVIHREWGRNNLSEIYTLFVGKTKIFSISNIQNYTYFIISWLQQIQKLAWLHNCMKNNTYLVILLKKTAFLESFPPHFVRVPFLPPPIPSTTFWDMGDNAVKIWCRDECAGLG